MSEIPSNILHAGQSPDAVLEALRRSGYPFQSLVARELREALVSAGSIAAGRITPEAAYVDSDTGEHRAVDFEVSFVVAADGVEIHFEVTLLVECKSGLGPHCFFPDAQPSMAPLPQLATGHSEIIIRTSRRETSLPVGSVVQLRRFPFVAVAPFWARVFARVDGQGDKLTASGEDIYRGIVLPLSKATAHFSELARNIAGDGVFGMTLPLCVLGGPLMIVDTNAGSNLAPANWVRLTRDTSKRREDGRASWSTTEAIDFVHISFLREYLQTHLLPFLHELAKELDRRGDILVKGRARAVNDDISKLEPDIDG